MSTIDQAKRHAYAEAAEMYPDRLNGDWEWSLFLDCVADLLGPDHPDTRQFRRGAEAYRTLAQCPNVLTR